MRRIFFILLSLFTLLPLSAQQTQDALYIFRNDGGFHGFFFADIEKIEFSKIDTLGVEHSDYVVQEVYALDSIYRIPISAIDSVCFVTPETKYKEGVVTSESTLWNYVIGSNDPLTCFTLSASTPASIVPKVGAKLANTKATTHLPYGFYGQVTSVSNTADGIEVVAERVPMEELFKQHVIKVATETANWSKSEVARRSPARRVPQTLIPLDLKPEYKVTLGLGDLSLLYPSDVIFSGTGNATLSIKPQVSARAFASIGWVTSSVYDMQFRNEMKTDFSFKASGTLMMRKDIKLIPKITVPIAATGFVFTMECGTTLSYSGRIEVDYHSYNHSVTNGTMMANIDPFGWVEETSMADGSVNLTRKELAASEEIAIRSKGTLQAGFFATPTISLLKVASLTARIEAGDRIALSGELGASASYTIPDGYTENIATSQYDELNHDGSVTIDVYTSGTAIGAVTGTKWKVTKSLYNEPIARAFSGALVPKFSDLGYVAGEGTSFVFSANLSRDVLFKAPVGFALYDSNNKLVKSKWADFSYDGTQKNYSLTFDGLQQDADYTLFPTCKVYGSELLGSPRMTFNTGHNLELTVTPQQLTFGQESGKQNFTVITPVEIQDIKTHINYRDGDPGWLKCSLLGSSDSDTWIYTANADTNRKPTDRTADIFITATTVNGTLLNGVLSVSQGANTASLETDPKLIAYCKDVSLSAEGEPVQIFVETDVERLSCGKTASWITVSYDQKTSKLNIGATKNDQKEARSGMVILTAKNEYSTKKDTIRVSQIGTIDVSKHKVLFTDMTVHAVIPVNNRGDFDYRHYIEAEFTVDSVNILVLESKLITEEGDRPIYYVNASGLSANGHHYFIKFDCTLIENGLDELHDTLVFSDISGYIDYGPAGDEELSYSFRFSCPPTLSDKEYYAYHLYNEPFPDDAYKKTLYYGAFGWRKYWKLGYETLYNWNIEDLYPFFHASYYYREENFVDWQQGPSDRDGLRNLTLGSRNSGNLNPSGKRHDFSIIVNYKKNEKIE